MLLRLLPSPSRAQPTPPTILFTLPLPNNSYTGRSLPLPSNLLAHKTVCLHEDIDCSNVLLGEKSTWISGIIDDVTFSLPLQNIRIHFIDGSATTLPLSDDCAQCLGAVVDQVNKSFSPVPTPTQPTSPSASSSISSSSSSRPSISIPSPRRSTSALLLTLLSPLLPGTVHNQQQATRTRQASDPQHVSRLYRRQARSLLVDTYRRFVLPELKASLPSAYLPWAIESEVAQRKAEYECVNLEINSILSSTGYDVAKPSVYNTPCKRARSFTASTQSSEGSSESESEYADTPLTSAQSSRCSSPSTTPSPQAFLLSIPPAHELPSAYRSTYSHHLADLTRIASRLSAIKKLDLQYGREESKRQWLENLERGKASERSLRKAWSNLETKTSTGLLSSKPIRSSKLRRSWTAEDEARESFPLATALPTAIHPAMMSEDDESDADSSSDDMCLVTPPHTATYGRRDSMIPPALVRPALISRHSTIELIDIEMEDQASGLLAPPMMPSKSDDSLSDSGSWDQDQDQDQDTTSTICSSSSNDDEVDASTIIRASIQQVALADSKTFILPNLPSRERWVDAYLSSTPSGFNAKTLGQSLKQKVVDWARHDSTTDHDHFEVPHVF